MPPTSDRARWTSAVVRRSFIDFFRDRGHAAVPSAPVVPLDDPTLLFTNAGMNQFKPLFLGSSQPGSPLHGLSRAVNSQKCIRAGGKHNDLEDVGKDTYHHTFFEMLGNWSFGDYFKREAIDWAWELLTKVFGIPADRLYATYFRGEPALGLEPDDEARQMWLRHLPPGRVLPGSMKDNFWEMGETGPCGPCSEIHFDRVGGRDAAPLVNAADPAVIEVWNLVFIQYDRQALAGTAQRSVPPHTTLRPLPARHVDTGMGLERLCAILQGASSNYDTDLFTPIFAEIERATGDRRGYHGRVGDADPDRHDMAYRVIADHIRTLTFAITDGAVPSNDGRGYVLRRILRRAARFARQMLDARPGLLADLVPAVVDAVGEAFPELRKNPDRVQAIIREEEESFGRTLDRGCALFEDFATVAGNRAMVESADPQTGDGGSAADFALRQSISRHGLSERLLAWNTRGFDWSRYEGRFRPNITGADAFTLYDTYGFPLDLTQLMAEERGLTVDVEGFERCMEEQRQRSRAAAKAAETGITLDAEAIARLKRMHVPPTDDADRYHARDIRATIKAIWNGHNFDEHARVAGLGRPVAVILDRTSFYAQAGGQVADHGRMLVTRERRVGDHHEGGEFRVDDVRSVGGYVLHIGRCVRGEVRVGDDVQLHVDMNRRRPTMANHTATHLLNFALREVLGDGVDQKGSLVAPDRLRFDFAHPRPIEPAEIDKVETIVRQVIARDLTVFADVVPLDAARRVSGLRAVFGEQYPDPVRMVSVGQPVADLLADPGNPAWRLLSVEFCGGTHLESTKEAGAFAIVSETGIAKGIRRIEALTGAAAAEAVARADDLERRLSAAPLASEAAQPGELAAISAAIDSSLIPLPRAHALRARLAQAQERARDSARRAAAELAARVVAQAIQIAHSAGTAGDEVVVSTIDAGSDRPALQQALRAVQDRLPRAAVMLLSVEGIDGPVAIIAGVSRAQADRGLKASEWVRHAAEAVGGKGGGRPEQAQGGGPDGSRVRDAVRLARAFAFKALGM